MKSRLIVAALACLAIRCGSGAAAPSPMPPFFENDGARLAFTLDLPPGPGPFPAIVTGHGSGKVTRDQLTWLSSRFVRMGFAVLRFDKRGTGESTGTFVFVGTNDSPDVFPQLAGDVAAAVRFLRTRAEIDPRKIGLAGNSQAGWILPIAARDLGDAAFMVLLAGPVCSVGQEMFYSDIVEHDSSKTIAEANARMSEFSGPHGFDPIATLQAVNTPALWALGLEDRSIPVPLTIANLETLKGGGRPFEWRTYEGLGHGLGPQVWPDIERWLAKFK
jgi:uncharacterized protein